MSVLWAFEEDWQHDIFEGDTQMVINAFQSSKENLPWMVSPLVKDLKLLVKDKSFWSFSYIPRSINQFAHEVAVLFFQKWL